MEKVHSKAHSEEVVPEMQMALKSACDCKDLEESVTLAGANEVGITRSIYRANGTSVASLTCWNLRRWLSFVRIF